MLGTLARYTWSKCGVDANLDVTWRPTIRDVEGEEADRVDNAELEHSDALRRLDGHVPEVPECCQEMALSAR